MAACSSSSSRREAPGSKASAAAPGGSGETAVGRLELVSKVERNDDRVCAAVIIGKEDGVITISYDRTIKVWIKRSSGDYWPSICQNLASAPICMDYCLSTRRLLVGLDNGTVMEFEIADDYNHLKHLRDHLAHQGSVLAVMYIAEHKWTLSCGSDQRFVSNSSDTGQVGVVYQISSPCTCLQYDSSSSYAFVGDASGSILVLKLSSNRDPPQKITSLKKHSDSVQRLVLDTERRLLYSASLDKSIIVWSIKDHEFTSSALYGHRDKVRSIALCISTNQLLSIGDDCTLVCWDMNGKREPAASWHQADACEICASPFYWNVRVMWENKTLGGRQHHCRRCGKALCAKCTSTTDVIPLMGFECPARTCDDCHQLLDIEQQAAQASIHNLFHSPTYIDIDEGKKIVLTVGKDKVIKLWDASSILK